MVQSLTSRLYLHFIGVTHTIFRLVGGKENPLQILSEYENIKRNVGETVQDYCLRFNAIYNAISANLTPPVGLALLKFPNGFDADMAYQLRETDPTTLEDVQKIAISVEANLLAKRARTRAEKRVIVKEEASPSDSKMDTLIRTVENMVYQLTISYRHEPQIRNPNFRGQQPQFIIKQREQRAQDQAAPQ